MPQMVHREVCGIPFKFEVEFIHSEELTKPYAVGTMPHVLLSEAGNICSNLGRGAYEVYILAMPNKGDTLEPVALSMMEEMCNHLEKSGVEFRPMYRNRDLDEDKDPEEEVTFEDLNVVDAVIFQMFQPA